MSGLLPANGRPWLRWLLFTTLMLCGPPAAAQTAGRAIEAVDLERLANGILGIMSYTVAPDLELRYTNVRLRNSGDLSDVIEGRASAESASLWARRRVPTGWIVRARQAMMFTPPST